MLKKYLLAFFGCIFIFCAAIILLFPEQFNASMSRHLSQSPFLGRFFNQPLYVWQTIAPDAPHGSTISWLGRVAGKGELELKVAEQSSAIYNAQVTPLPQGDMAVYTVRLRTLAPDTVYRYRVACGRGRFGAWHDFKTPREDEQECTALFLSSLDSSTDYSNWRKMVKTAFDKNPDVNFYLDINNIANNDNNLPQWKLWFGAVDEYSPRIPVAPLSCNPFAKKAAKNGFNYFQTMFPIPDNASYFTRNHVYSFNSGPVHFVCLDTAAHENGNLEKLFYNQEAWLARDLATTKKPWRIVIINRPLFSDPDDNVAQKLAAIMLPVLDKGRVDMIITSSLSTEQGDYSSIYVPAGVGAHHGWKKLASTAIDKIFYEHAAAPLYLYLKASPHQLTLAAHDMNGNLLDTWQTTK